jgi:hypothetical protein
MRARRWWGPMLAVAMLAGCFAGTPRAGAAGVPAAWFTNLSYNTSNGGWIDATTAGDLNGDGLNDVAVTTAYEGGNVEVFYQKPDHTLDTPVVVDSAGTMLRIADINGDGRPDLLNFTPSGVDVRLQLANGTLAAVTQVPIANFSGQAEIGDYNGDGRTDVVAIRTDNSVAVLLQQANGTLGAPVQLAVYPSGPSFLALADLNGDHKLDVGVLYGTTLDLRNQGAGGTLGSATDVTTPDEARDFVFGDFNHDGRTDVAISHNFSGSDYVIYRNTDNSWGPAVGLTEPGDSVYTSSVRAADVNNDGKMDLVAIKSHNDMYVYLQGAQGLSLQPIAPGHSVMQWPTIQDGWVADVNGDGWPDLISAAYYGPLSISLNTTATEVSGIQGTVTDEADTDAPGITVDAFDGNGVLTATTSTNATGHYYFPWSVIDPGASYTLRFTDPASVHPTAWYGTGVAEPSMAQATPVSYTLGAATTANFMLPAAASATGKVLNGHGQAVSGLTVSLAPAGSSTLATTSTASDGTYSFPKLVPGTYTVSVSDPGHAYESEWWGLPGRAKSGTGPHLAVSAPTTDLGAQTIGASACATASFVPGANLSGQTLTGCWLHDVSLGGATFHGSDLAGAQLVGATLTTANLSNTDLSNADLFLATMAGSDRTSALYSATTCPDGTNSDADGHTCDGHLANPVGSDTPVGSLTSVTVGTTTHAVGWAIDPDTVNPVTVRVTIDGATPVSVVANLASSAPGPALAIYGADHGFDAVLGPVAPGVHDICATAVNLRAGSDAALGCQVLDSPVTNTTYTPVTPARLLDTRNGTGTGGVVGPVGANSSINLTVEGVDGIPSSHVGAVVLNVTATQPTANSYLTVWPTLTSRPVASNLNFGPGQTVPNLVMAKVGGNGQVSIYNQSGTVQVVADVEGYYDDGTGGGGRYHPVTPVRVLDTRSGTGVAVGVVGAGQVLHLQVAGNNGVPLGTAAAVVLNVTVAAPTASSFLTVYPDAASRPLASNLNFGPGQTVPNLVVVKLSADGWVDFYNDSGSTQVVADLAGWFDSGGTSGTRFNPLSPTRVLDTRFGTGAPEQPLASSSPIHVHLAGVAGIPVGAQAVVLNVTVANPSAAGFLTVYPSDASAPLASNLNFVAGQTVANLVVVKVSSDGWATFSIGSGTTDVVADVAGWYW